MTSFFRRAGQKITRLLAVAADPGAESDRVIGYAKNVGIAEQLFARSPDFARQVSGVECNIFDRPLSAHALDDEFESTVLDPSWTMGGIALTANAINPYAGNPIAYALHTNYRPSWLMTQASIFGGTRFSKDISSISANDFFAWFRGSFNTRFGGVLNNDAIVSLDLTADPWDVDNRVSIQLNETDAGIIQAEFFITVGAVTTSIGTTQNQISAGFSWAQPIEAAGIQKIEVAGVPTYHGWVFGRNGSAIWLGSATYAAAISVASLGVVNSSGAAPGAPLVGFDFIRFKESSVWLP